VRAARHRRDDREIITNLQRTGTHPLLDKLREDVPEGVLDMLSIPGLKPDKINIIHRELGITDLAALQTAAREGRLKNVKGLGAAVQRKILQGLEIREHGLGARHLHRADELAAWATETLQRSIPHLVRTVTAGDIRRGGELVSDLALVAEVKRLAGPPKVIKSGEISVHLTDTRRFGITLLLATGSRRHVETLEQRAAAMGMALTPAGLRRGRKIVAARSEAEIYEALGLQSIEPELRGGLDACAEHDVAVEVNGNPWRLDLDWRWLRRGLELGCSFSIDPDAHSTGEITSSTRWGLAIAGKVGMPADG
jgi:DNA polymerase (family 10)